jgi:hypothetical protein
MADELPTEGPLTRDEVSDEMQRITFDASHPHHQGYKVGAHAATAYVDSLYQRISGANQPVLFDQPVVRGIPPADAPPEYARLEQRASEADDEAFRQSVAAAVAERGISLDQAGAEGSKLFAGKVGDETLLAIESATMYGLAPEAERQAHVEFALWLSDLASLRQAPAGDAPADFDVALQQELRKLGINVDHLDQELAAVFGGRPDAYQHVMAHLDSFPPGARLAAYVRSARALVSLMHLRQSVA